MGSDLGFAIIGLGMDAIRAELVDQTHGARLQCVVDANAQRAEEIGSKFDCAWSTRLDDALADNAVDVVYVMTPSGLHADMSIRAMEAGKHVITTKPMEVSLEKCDAMIAAQEKAGKLLAIDFEQRYFDVNQKIKYGLNNGLFGKPILCEARLKWYRHQDYYDRGAWHGTWKLDGGGSLANQSIHFIDLMCWFMGQPKRVIGKIGIFNHDIETEDLGVAIVEFASGAVGSILGTTTFPASPIAGVHLHGSEGGVLTTRGEPEWFFLEPFAERGDQLQRIDPPNNVVEDMLRALKQGTPLVCDGQEGRRSLDLVKAIYQSSKNNSTPVEL